MTTVNQITVMNALYVALIERFIKDHCLDRAWSIKFVGCFVVSRIELVALSRCPALPLKRCIFHHLLKDKEILIIVTIKHELLEPS